MQHQVVSPAEWLEARKKLLKQEKALTLHKDLVSAERLRLPWVRVGKDYVFEGPHGKLTLSELFQGRSQLYIKHFMMAPGAHHQCVGCSLEVDHMTDLLPHLENHDISYVVIARAPIEEIEVIRKRVGWKFLWVSAFDSDFNYDFNVSFTPDQVAGGKAYYNYELRDVGIDELSGRSVFYRDTSGDIFHTYSSFARGGEMFLGSYAVLDIVPNGRNETINGNLTDWVRHHDRYDDGDANDCCQPA